MRTYQDVLKFWFETHGSEDWFAGDPAFDEEVERVFNRTHVSVRAGEAFEWRRTAEGRFAEIIVLDQFSRQLFRDDPRAFVWDPMALALAQEMVAQGLDKGISPDRRMFAYMPYMHSESLRIHEEAMRLFETLGDEKTLDFERRHLELIKRFGRFPKRNQALGRTSTPEEVAYINQSEGMF